MWKLWISFGLLLNLFPGIGHTQNDTLSAEMSPAEYYSQIFEEFSYALEATDSFFVAYEMVDDDPNLVLEEKEFWQDQIILSIDRLEELEGPEDFVFLKDAVLQVLYKMNKLATAYGKQITLIKKSKKKDVNWDKLMYQMSMVNNDLNRHNSELDPLLNQAGKLKKGMKKKLKVKDKDKS